MDVEDLTCRIASLNEHIKSFTKVKLGRTSFYRINKRGNVYFEFDKDEIPENELKVHLKAEVKYLNELLNIELEARKNGKVSGTSGKV